MVEPIFHVLSLARVTTRVYQFGKLLATKHPHGFREVILANNGGTLLIPQIEKAPMSEEEHLQLAEDVNDAIQKIMKKTEQFEKDRSFKEWLKQLGLLAPVPITINTQKVSEQIKKVHIEISNLKSGLNCSTVTKIVESFRNLQVDDDGLQNFLRDQIRQVFIARLDNQSHPFEAIVNHCLADENHHTQVACWLICFIILEVYLDFERQQLVQMVDHAVQQAL